MQSGFVFLYLSKQQVKNIVTQQLFPNFDRDSAVWHPTDKEREKENDDITTPNIDLALCSPSLTFNIHHLQYCPSAYVYMFAMCKVLPILVEKKKKNRIVQGQG